MSNGTETITGPVVFRSAVDAWLAILVFAAMVIAPVAVVASLVAAWPGWLPAAGTLLLALLGPAIVFLLAWPARYVVESDRLVVRAGLCLRWTVLLDAIEAIEPSSNPLSSPAWSLNRLRVTYREGRSGTKRLLISPARREQFFDALIARSSRLRREGEGLAAATEAARPDA